MRKITLYVLTFFFGVLSAVAQPGFLDGSFGDNGKVGTPAVTGLYTVGCLQKDGKILSAGRNLSNIMMVLRHLANGDVDSSFGVNGVKTIDLPA